MVTVERMRPGDIAGVRRLWGATEGIGIGTSDAPRRIRAYLRRNPGLSFVAKRGGVVVGAVLCGHDGRRGYMHHLAMARECRRRGVGERLVRRCLRALARIGILRCNAYLFASNRRGRKFWENRGWKVMKGILPIQGPTGRK